MNELVNEMEKVHFGAIMSSRTLSHYHHLDIIVNFVPDFIRKILLPSHFPFLHLYSITFLLQFLTLQCGIQRLFTYFTEKWSETDKEWIRPSFFLTFF